MRSFRKPSPRLRGLSYALCIALAQPWGLAGSAYAAYVDDTAARMPANVANSYDFDIADVDGNGTPDVLVANRGQSRLLLNDGDGFFADATGQLPAALYTTLAVAFIDADGVGGIDALLVGEGQNRLLLNDGTGTFTDVTATNLPLGMQTSLAVAVADLDGDTDMDAVIGNRASANQILINNGAGVFTDQSSTRLAADADFTYAVAIGDANADNSPDIFFANFSGQNRLHHNNFLGVFADVTDTNLPPGIGSSGDAVFIDVHGDGGNDIAVADGPAGVTLLLNNAGMFVETPSNLPALNTFATKIRTGDINFDGAADLLVGAMGQDLVLLNDGLGLFSDATASEMPADDRRSFGLALADADQDLDLDLLVATPQGQNRYYDNQIEAPRVSIDVSPDYIEVNDTVTITVDAFDEDGVNTLIVEVVRPDGTTVDSTIPLGGNLFEYTPLVTGTHTVRVTADDLLGNGVVRTRTFEAQPADTTDPSVTLVLSTNNIVQGQSASFTVTATDDRGVVNRTLSVGGVDVPLNAAGQATFTPTASGSLNVVAEAFDAAGNSGQASDTLIVAADVNPPLVSLSAEPDSIEITNPISINASASDDIVLVSFGVTVTGPSGGPVDEPVPLDGAGNGSYTPFIPGLYTFEATAVDGGANTTIQTTFVNATGIPDNENPVVNLSVVPGTTIPGGTVTLTVNATDNIFVLTQTLEINGSPLTLDTNNRAQFTAPGLGSFTAVATATDPTGNVGTDTVVFNSIDPATDTTEPTVAITGPAEGADIAGTQTFIGTASDTSLVDYTLGHRPAGSSAAFTTFFTGTVSAEDDVLGALDTTVLDKGLVEIQLKATDINGAENEVISTFNVDGGFTPGIFTITYTDLDIPVSGIPITIKRTYDSRDRAINGDFGNGWNLEVVQDATYKNNITPGSGWSVSGSFPNFCGTVTELAFHRTQIRFSDTEFYDFAFGASGFSAITGGCFDGSGFFTQVGGVPGATLDIIGSNSLSYTGSGSLTYDPTDPRFGLVYNPEDVRLTTLDGRVFDINLNNGLERIGDANGNSLFINPGSIAHSNGTGVVITRGTGSRITEIQDPAGNSLIYTYDPAGNLTSVTDRNGKITSFTYTTDNFLTRIDDPEGNTPLRNEYDASGRLVAQIDAAGNRTEYDHDVAGNTETVTDRDGTPSVFEYDDEGNLTRSDIGAASQTYTYDARGNRLTETDGNGNTITFTYNANDQVTSETDPLGNTTSYDYDAEGRVAGITDPGGAELNFTYDGNGNLTEQRDAGGNLIQGMTVDASGNPDTVTTAAGTTLLDHDANGNITKLTQPNGVEIDYTYNALGQRTGEAVTRTTPTGPVVDSTTYAYDGNGNLTQITNALGDATQHEYDGNNRKTKTTDALLRETDFTYDNRGLLTRIDHPDGTFEVFGYDMKGRRTAHTDELNRTRFFEYDGNDNITKVILPDGSSTLATYDAANRRTSTTDTLGNTTTYAYDAANRLVTETRVVPAGPNGVTSYTYTDNQVNPTTITDPLGRVTTYTRDVGMLFTEYLTNVEHPDGTDTQQTWTANSRIASKTDENGNASAFTYDAAGNLATVTDALGNTTTYTYDEAGNRLTQTDALTRTTSFTYDALGQMLTRTLPDGEVETFTYDEVGNVASHADFNGATTTFTYDTRNRLTGRTFSGGLQETLVYDNGGNLTSVSQTLGGSTVTSTFTYDARDRIASSTDPNGRTVSYAYDLAGNRTSVTTPGGTTAYTYDDLNRVETVTDDNGDTVGYGYDANDNVTDIIYPNGTEATLTYDNRNRTVRVQHTGAGGTPVLADYQYTLDAVGNRTRIVEAAGRTLDFSYDVLNQLTRVIEDPGGANITSSYTYDAVGNVLTIPIPGSSLTATYDVNDRVLNVDSRSYAYDDNGNLTTITDGADTTSFVYDERNRLIERTEPGGLVTSFAYDFAGNRISRTVSGVTTDYVIDANDPSGVGKVVEERTPVGGSPDDQLQARYAHGHGVTTVDRGGAQSFYHPDALGSTRVLTNAGGTATDTYDYDAHGNVVASTGSTANDILFAGEQQDPSTGLHYLRARYYDPEIMRFISRDPHPGNPMLPKTLHPYMYAGNNPQNMIDPNGEFSMVSVSISIAIVGILSSIAYNSWIKPAVETAEELLINIPNSVLNENATREQLGWPNGGAEEASLAALVNLGGGVVEKAYSVVYDMSTTAGTIVALIHARNSAVWMRHLPAHENIPGNYVDCAFNSYVQKTYSLGLVMGTAAASRFSGAGNVIAAYLAYFNFLMLVMETVSDNQALPQPVEDADLGGAACPALVL